MTNRDKLEVYEGLKSQKGGEAPYLISSVGFWLLTDFNFLMAFKFKETNA